MKAGVTTSVIAHVALLIVALAGLGSAKPLAPEVVESIAVDLVPISAITNIRQGSLKSTVVKTETPAIVDTPKPAALAKPTGNTEQDQVKPQETDKATPAPTVNTAPEPKPAPDPTPTPDSPKPQPPKPVPVVAPDVAPKPVEAQPQQDVTASTAEAPADSIAPVPASKPAELQKAPVKAPPKETKIAAVTPKPDPTPPKNNSASKLADDKAARIADQVAELINSEKSRGAVTGDSGQATLGKVTGRSATLTQSQLDGLIAQIRDCQYYNPPVGAADAGATVQLQFSIGADGNVTSTPEILSNPASQIERALASAAQRGIMRCGPYTTAQNQDVRATFDPRTM